MWSYRDVLRDAGVGVIEHTEQLTYLLFLRMAHERATRKLNAERIIPDEYSWTKLLDAQGDQLELTYTGIFGGLTRQSGVIGTIFREAQNRIQDPAKLRRLVIDLIGQGNWSSTGTDIRGDANEELLSKAALRQGSGAGQYFTPRPLIQAIVDCVRQPRSPTRAPRPPPRLCSPASTSCGSPAVARHVTVDFADNVPKHLAVWRHMIGYAGRRIGELGVGAGQYPYLFALYSTDHRSQQSLSDELLVDKSSTTAAIDKLEEQGLVTRSPDPSDRRRHIVSLTRQGTALRPRLEAVLGETADTLLTGLTPTEREVFTTLLRRIATNALEADGAA